MKAPRQFPVIAAFILCATASLSARDPASYNLGDRVEEDITTPVALVVVDRQATAALIKNEEERVPAVMRFVPEALDQAARSFHESFVKTRGDFLDAVEQGFDRRKLDANALDSEQFTRLVASFQKKNPVFPLTTNLARLWAGGGADQLVETPLLESLRNEMSLFIRATNLVADGAQVGGTVRVISYDDDETLTEQMIARHGTNHPRSDFISLPRAKSELLNSFPAEERATARFVASFLKPNCFVEEELTLVLRAKHLEAVSVAQEFPAGSFIARRGELVNEKMLMAVATLNQKLAVDKLRELAARDGAGPEPGTNRRLVASIAAVGALVLVATILFWISRRGGSMVVLPPAAREIGHLAPPHPPLSEQSWQERALAAEQRAEKAQAVIRQGLIGNLARWMSDTLVQKLLVQRAYLIEAQQKAVSEVDRLGQRLESIHSRMSDRLMAYEKRILELEQELETKDEINRELIKAEIQTIRGKIAAERAQGEGSLN